MQIETREELINALMDAAELEHNLACLYLFAAFTIKDSVDELVNVPQADRDAVLDDLRTWKFQILDIALQEMGHLGTVANLLTLVGAEAHFDRPNFPPPDGYYPPAEVFTLEPFGIDSLRRFVEFERNANQPGIEAFGIAPRGVTYQHVGELYAAVLQAFEERNPADPPAGGIDIPDEELFLGYDKALDRSWNSAVEVHDFGLRNEPPTPIGGLRAAVRLALVDVIEEGEGANDPQVDSHYEKFRAIAQNLRTRQQQFNGFEPSRNAATNPMTQRHRDSGDNVAVIESQLTKDVAELFNSFYGSLLLSLRQNYAFSEDLADDTRLGSMHRVCSQIMKRAIGPIGEVLTRLPLTDATGSRSAGPGFEIYRPLYVSTEPDIAWSVVRERLVIAQRESERLETQTFPANDMSGVFRNAGRVAGQLIALIDNTLISADGSDNNGN